MNEDVIINIASPGAEVTAAEFKKLAEGADKASVSVDKLTGAVSGQITVIDKETGTVKKLVVEKGKLKSATESYTVDLAKEQAAAAAAAAAQEKVIAATARATAEKQKATEAAKQNSSAVSVLTGLVGGLASAFSALVVGKAVGDLLKLNDSMQQTSNTLRAYTGSIAEYSAASAQLSAVATSQGASLNSLVTAYGNLRTSTTFARTEAATLTGVIGAANAAIRLTAPNAQAAAQGLNSFTEQLAKGRISGDEFAKIMKEFPALANALAQGSGIGAESLKVLGISSGMATDALLRQKGALDEATKANASLSQAFDVLKEKFAEYVSNSEGVNNSSKLLSEILKFVGKNIDLIITALGAAVIAWGTYRVAVIAATAVSVIFNTTTGSGVIGIILKLVSLLATAAAAWYAYKSAVDAANDSSKNVNPPKPNSPDAQALRDQQRKESYTRQSNAPPPVRAPAYTNDSGTFESISGERAAGGPVSVGKKYLVGEEGPELFIPGKSGSIVPTGKTQAAMGGGGAAASVSTQTATDMLAAGVMAGTKDAFALLQTSLDKLLALVQTAATNSSAGGSSGAGSAGGGTGAMDALIPGVSAINNFGQPTVTQPTGGGGGSMPSAPSMPASNGGGITDTSNGAILAYVKGYADLLMKNWDTKGQYLTDKQRERNYLNAERYLANVPSGLQDQVKQLANLRLPAKNIGSNVTGPGFRSGGSFTIPGSTGADSKDVSMRVSPGERVDVLTRKQQQQETGGGNVTNYYNLEMTVKSPDVNSFRNSEKQLGRQALQELAKARS